MNVARRGARGLVMTVLNLGAAGAGVAQGGPPLRTDDPGTPGPGRWEVNTAVTVERVPGRTAFEAPLADVNYGLGERLQLKVEAPLELIDGSGPGLDAGMGNPLVGVKWRFAEDRAAGFAVSTYPQLELVSPAQTEAGKLEEAGDALLLPVEVKARWGGVDWNAEVGYRLIAHTGSRIIYGLVAGRELTDRLELAAECNGESEAELREAAVVCSMGARGRVAEHFTLLGALGRGVSGPRAERPSVALYLGLQSVW